MWKSCYQEAGHDEKVLIWKDVKPFLLAKWLWAVRDNTWMSVLPIYSLCQKKRTFNPEFFCGPPGKGGPKIHMVDYVNAFLAPLPQGGHKKIQD